jgi:hypothetical protein
MPAPDSRHPPRVLAVASGGGHWKQLRRIIHPIDGIDLAFVTTLRGYRDDTPARWHFVVDANRNEKLRLIRLVIQLTWVLLRERPDVVVTTGAAPGYLALRLGKLLGARTVWIDSIANGDELSLSGKKAGRHADLWLTQWPHLAAPQGPHFKGSIL